jgi:hypothetical protein
MSVVALRLRERKRRAWKGVEKALTVVQWTCTSVCLLSVPAAIFLQAAYGGSAFVAFNMVLFVLAMVGTKLIYSLRKKAETKTEKYTDQRFATRAYAAVIRSLRNMNIAEPAVFIDERPLHVESYLAVKHAATNALDSHHSRMNSRATANQIHDEAHCIAMLVFPGQADIAREDRIVYFLETRGIMDYGTIVEMLNETDGQPLPLLEGAL